MKLTALLTMTTLGVFMVADTGTTFAASQSFDTDPGWTGVGNTSDGNMFGLRASNNAGGNINEAGGDVARSVTRAYYADTNLLSTLTLNDPITASGRLAVSFAANNAVRIGHFSTLGPDNMPFDFIGLQVAEPEPSTDTQYRVFASMFFEGDNLFTQTSEVLRLAPDDQYTWSYEWDPTFNGGNGSLTLDVFDATNFSVGTSVLNLTAAQRSVDPSYDAFGISTGGVEGPIGVVSTLYIDDVEYTAVPEPNPPHDL